MPRLFLVILFLVVVGSDSARPDDRLALSDNGVTEWRIVVSSSADESTRAVARDFVAILKDITGADFSVVGDQTEPRAREIVLGGANARLQAVGLAGLTDGFTPGEYEIRSVGRRLVIAGVPPRGTINGMYGFLQDHLGCRWFTPGVSRILKRSKLTIEPIADRQRPAFRRRTTCAPEHWDPSWTVRNRLNVAWVWGGPASEKALMDDPRAHTLSNPYNTHSFSYIPKDLFDSHPEFFAEIDGKRVCVADPNSRAYCTTNSGFRRYLAATLKSKLRAQGGKGLVGLSQSDTRTTCQCAACKDAYTRVGSSGAHMEMVNAVAAEVATTFPAATIVTLAYFATFDPNPVKAQANVRVVWCPIDADYARPFDHGEYNRDQDWLGQLQRWLDKVDHLDIWYYHYHADALMPAPRLFATAANFRTFIDMGVPGMRVQPVSAGRGTRRAQVPDGDGKLLPAFGAWGTEQGAYFTVPFGLRHVHSYVVSRLMWNPTIDVGHLIREFCRTYYGDAAGETETFILAVESLASYEPIDESQGIGSISPFKSTNTSPRLKWVLARRLDALFDAAEAKVANEPTLLRRVQMLRMPLQMSIMCYAPQGNPLRRKAYDAFLSLGTELQIEKLGTTGISHARMKTLDLLREEIGYLLGEEPADVAGQGRNLAPNGDFEIDVNGDGLPDGWRIEGDVRLDPDAAVKGSRSLRIDQSSPASVPGKVTHRTEVTPGSAYTGFMRYRSEVRNSSATMRTRVYGADGRQIKYRANYGVSDTDGQWLVIRFDETPVPPGARSMTIELCIRDEDARGIVWIDDVRVMEMTRQQ